MGSGGSVKLDSPARYSPALPRTRSLQSLQPLGRLGGSLPVGGSAHKNFPMSDQASACRMAGHRGALTTNPPTAVGQRGPTGRERGE